MADPDFAKGTETFLSWFTAQPGAFFHPDIRLADLRGQGGGRGIVATADLPADTVLFTVPRSSILSVATSALPVLLPSLFPAQPSAAAAGPASNADEDDLPEASQQDAWTALILVLLYEHLRSSASPWAPYLSFLPRSFETPMFWSDAELAALQASAVAGRVGRTEADEMIAARVVPVVRAHADVFGYGGDDDALVALAHRLGSAIMAYAFDLERDADSDDEGDAQDGWVEDRPSGAAVLGMVPMADVLNADADFNAHISHEAEEGPLVATALRPIARGEEVLNYYGPLSNGELLRRYGYVTKAHRRWDVVELPWALVAAGIREELSLREEEWDAATQSIEAEEVEDSFVIQWGSSDPDSTGHVDPSITFHGLPDDLAEQVKLFLQTLRKLDLSSEAGERLSSSEGRKKVYLCSILRALEVRAAQYATSLEEDERSTATEAPTGRLGMAMVVRMGEKALLSAARSWVQGEIAHTISADEDGPQTKRQRMER